MARLNVPGLQQIQTFDNVKHVFHARASIETTIPLTDKAASYKSARSYIRQSPKNRSSHRCRPAALRRSAHDWSSRATRPALDKQDL